MKKTIYLFFLLGIIFTCKDLNAQMPAVVVSPQTQCYSAGGNTAVAYVSPGVPGAASYSWAITGPTTCVAGITTYSNGSIAYLNLPCCGVYTLYTFAYSSGASLLDTLVQTATVLCSGSISTSVTPGGTICAGSSAVIYASGASSYTWSNGVVSPSIAVSPSVSTCYSVTGYSIPGCFVSGVRCIAVGPPPVLTVSGDTSVCAGNSSTLTAGGASGYTWYTAQGTFTGNTIVLTPTATSCYSLVGTTSSGCMSYYTGCVSISQGTPNPVISSSNFNICAGSTTTLYASGASTYTWFPSGIVSPSLVITPSATTCYTLVGYSCFALGSTARCVTVSASVPLTVSGNTTICAGYGATLTASGASTYTWLTSMGTFTGSTIVLTPSATSCYSLIGTTSSGCMGYGGGCVTVSQGTPNPVISSSNFNICAGSTTTLYASGASTYTWFPSGIVSPSLVVTPSTTTCYTLVGYSCFALGSTARCVTVSPSGSVTVTGNTTVCTGNGATLTASGASTYTWLTSMGTFTGSTIVLTPTATSCYSLIASNGTGCMSYAGGCVTVSQGTPNPVISSSNFNICAGSTTTLYASGASTYTWFPSGIVSPSLVVTPSTTTCYTLVGYSCFALGSTARCVTVSPSGSVTVTGNSTVCAGNGATLTASGASTYTWLTSMGTFTGSTIVLTPTATSCYSLIASNGAGCMSYAGGCVTVSQGTPNPVISSNLFNICNGGTSILYASGASSYTWFPSGIVSSSLVVTPSVTTCYTLVGYSCFALGSAVRCVTVDPTPVISVSGNTTICPGYGATLTASGASAYTWYTTVGTFTGSTIVLSPSATACYTLVGSNFTGCNGYAFGCITLQSSPLGISGNTTICTGESTTLTAGGASSYTWSNGTVGASIVVSPSTTTCYTVFGITTGSCGSAYRVVCVVVNPIPVISTTGNYMCYGQPSGMTAFGASTYTWLPFNHTGSVIAITPSVSSCYTVIGTSAAGCTGSVINCYSVVAPPTITISGSSIVCSGSTATLTASGTTSYTWFPSGYIGAQYTVAPLSNTCYTVASDYYGCSSSAVKCLSVQASPTLAVSGTNSICAGSSATLLANGASTYTWIPGNITGPVAIVSPSADVCYTVVGTSPNGCIGIGHSCVQLSSQPIITTSSTVFCGGTPGMLTAQGASSYTWLPYNVTGSSITITPSVSSCYTVIGSNGTGCTGSATGCFSVLPAPSIFVTGNDSICAGATTTLTAGGASSYTWYPGNHTGASIVITPSANVCYTVIGSNGYCISAGFKCVTVQSGSSINIIGTNLLCAGSSANLLASGASTYTWNTGSHSPFITVTPSVSGCYTLTGTTSGGCVGYAVKCISVQPVPFVTISGLDSVCAGSTIVLNASGASSYVWSNGSTSNFITVSPAASTVYSVTGSNGLCSGTASHFVGIMPRPNIQVFRMDTLSNDSIICAGTSVHLYADGADTFTWSNGSNSPYITVTPTVTSTYTVSGTNLMGCSNSNIITLAVFPCTGIEKTTAAELQIGIYPNPSSGQLTIQGNGASKINFTIYDVTGRELIKGEFTDTKTVDLSGYANGTYLIRLGSGTASTYKKLILENK